MTHFIRTIVSGFILIFTISNLQAQADFSLENVTAGIGSTFPMDFTAENLTNVTLLQFTVNWDPNILELQDIDNIHPSFTGININTAGSGSGFTTFSFADGPATLPDGERLFEINFKVLSGAGSSTNVTITDMPFGINVTTSPGGEIGLVSQGGTVNISNPIIFSLPDTIQNPGASFCLPVSVENFNSLFSIQSAINWDPTVLEYSSVTNFNLSNLDAGAFSIIDLGTLGFSWSDDMNGIPITLPDGTVIFEICFNVIGSVNDMTTIVFDENPVPIEVIQDGNNDNLGLESTGGKVNIQQTLFVTNSTLTPPNCYDTLGGAINIAVAGGTGPYTYLWSTMSTEQDIEGIGPGNYVVTITDSSTPANTFISSFSLFGDLASPIADAGGVDTISCTEPTTILDGTGSASGDDIIYEWVHNDGTALILDGETNMPTVNGLGFYTLTVTDTISGCTDTDFAIVEGDMAPPVVDAGLPDTLNCLATSLQLNGTVAPTGNYTFLWTTMNGGNITDPTTLTPTVDMPGTYQLLVEETGTGCFAMDTVTIANNNATPIADAGSNLAITCGNNQVVLDGSNSSMGDNITYQWTGNGTIIDADSPTPTVDATGTFTLEVMNTTSNCSATSTVMVTENINAPTAVAAAANPEIDCTVNTVMLDGTGSSTGNNITYLWVGANGGNVASGDSTLTPTVDAGGDYYLIVTDTINGCTASDTTMVTEDGSIPVANAGEDRVINCNNPIVQLDGSDSSLGGQYEYFWTTDSGNFVTDSVTGIAPMVNGAGTYTIQVTDMATNCVSISSVNVEVDTFPPVSNLVASSFLSCSLPEVLLIDQNNTPTADLIFSWSGPTPGIVGVTAEGGLIVNAIGEYCINLNNTASGCESTSCITVTENITPPTADAGTDFQIGCSPTGVTLDGSGSATGNDFIYQWVALSGEDPTDETTLSPGITSPGEYLIMVTDTINGCMNMDTVEVTMDENYPIVEAGGNVTLTCNDPEIVLDASTVSSSDPDFIFSWVNGDGNTDGLTNPNTLTPTVNLPGLYVLTITNTVNNCSATDQLIVFTNNTPPVAVVAQDTVSFDCESTAILDATGTTGFGVEYLWKTNLGTILAGGDSLVATISQGGEFTFCVTNPSNGCSDTADVFVFQKEPAPEVIVEFPDNITCATPLVTLDATGSTLLPNQIFNWSTGMNGNFVDGQETLNPTINQPAFYSFIVTDTITGCIYGGGALVLLDTNSVVVTGMADSIITCQNNLINLEATVTTNSNNLSTEWTSSMGGNIISPDPSELMIQGDAAGTYTFIAMDTITGCADTVDVIVGTDTIPPIADAGMMMELPCSASSVTLDGSGSSLGLDIEYLWTPEANVVSGQNTNMADVDETGDYTLIVTSTINGCTASSTVNVFSSEAVTATAVAPLVQLDCGVLSISLDGTGSTEGATVTYLWTASMGGMIENGETTLTPEVSSPGTYTLLVTDTATGCTDEFDVIVEFNNSFPNADAGEDMTTCEDIFSLAGNLPANTTGLWLSLGSGIPTDPADPNTEVTNLQIGENLFVWTLSAIGCPEYSSDTVNILLEFAPDAMDDSYTLEEGQVLDINVGSNDDAVGGTFVTLSEVTNGTLVETGMGTFTYTPDQGYIGPDEFQYELCAVACPDACDIATVSIFVNPAEPKTIEELLDDKTNVITPNDDGLNDNLVFEILIQNQGEYEQREFIVFNRWGNIVYETKEYNNDWNGTNNNNKPLPDGTYYFILRLDVDQGIILKGDVTILR